MFVTIAIQENGIKGGDELSFLLHSRLCEILRCLHCEGRVYTDCIAKNFTENER